MLDRDLVRIIELYNPYYPRFVHPATKAALEQYALQGILKDKVREQEKRWLGTAERPLERRSHKDYDKYAEDSLIGPGGFWSVPALMPKISRESGQPVLLGWTTDLWDGSPMSWLRDGERYAMDIFPKKRSAGEPWWPELMPPGESRAETEGEMMHEGYDPREFPRAADAELYLETWQKRWEWLDDVAYYSGLGFAEDPGDAIKDIVEEISTATSEISDVLSMLQK